MTTYDPDHKAHMNGKPCKTCGHGEGTHESLEEEDLDDPDRVKPGCSVADCDCPEFAG